MVIHRHLGPVSQRQYAVRACLTQLRCAGHLHNLCDTEDTHRFVRFALQHQNDEPFSMAFDDLGLHRSTTHHMNATAHAHPTAVTASGQLTPRPSS